MSLGAEKHDRRPSVHVADAVLPLRGDRHVDIFAVALLAALRRRSGLRPRTWRIAYTLLAVVIVVAAVVHAILIEGTMETVSKAALCVLVLAATIKVMAGLRVWRKHTKNCRLVNRKRA